MSRLLYFFYVLVPFGFLAFAARRLLTYLHLFQQEEYDNRRFAQLLWDKKLFDKRLSAILVLIGIAPFLSDEPLTWLWDILLAASFFVFAGREADPRQRAKKKLVMTSRARRILICALVYNLLWTAFTFILHMPFLWLISVQFIPLTLLMANVTLAPYEDSVQKKFWNEAHEKLAGYNATVIGVTGSYGKTSVKHILGHILQNAAPTLITPGSVNTPMGITRIIREQLTDRHKYFVVEMGAYGPGSIDRLCRLAPPDMGIITAIGPAHYERFRSLETVAEAKFELAEHVAEQGGQTIVNAQTLGFPKSQALYKVHPDMFVICADKDNPHADKAALQLGTIEQTAEGLSVEIIWQGQSHILRAPLYGLHHGQNMAVAFAAACTLGISAQAAAMALKSVPQIAHRLEVKPQGNGYLIDDAYNANPKGFAAALELLALLGEGKRRILVTPGIVELGDAHDREHAKLGALAAEKANIVIAVSAERIQAFTTAFREKAGDRQALIEVENFEQARTWLSENGMDGDVILLENDLPDLYESLPKL